jgi:hypothetical protein
MNYGVFSLSFFQAQTALHGVLGGLPPFLVLTVRRSHVLEDSLAQISAWPHHLVFLRRPLKISFVGELGQDEGGLLKVHTSCQI